jgi:hypothetical protein
LLNQLFLISGNPEMYNGLGSLTPKEVKIEMWQHGSGLMWPQEVKIDMWQHGSGLMWPQESRCQD